MGMTNTAPRFRFVGVTDETTTCEECGKPELRSTVVLALLDADGNVDEHVRYGSTCAARALGIPGGGVKVRKLATNAAYRTRAAAADARDVLGRYGVDESGVPADRMKFLMAYTANNAGSWTSIEDVEADAMGMVTRHVATIREARLIGA